MATLGAAQGSCVAARRGGAARARAGMRLGAAAAGVPAPHAAPAARQLACSFGGAPRRGAAGAPRRSPARGGHRGRTVAIVAPVIEQGEQGVDLMRFLLQQRIIFVGRPINDMMAQQIVSALMALEMADPEADIKMYLNTSGGQQYSIMAVIDMMNLVKCDVMTVAFGNVASAAALVLASGTKGKRFSMKNTRIMLNQPLGGCQGSFVDVKIQAAEQNRNLKIAQTILSSTTGRSMDECAELLDRESFLSPEQAVELKIIDGVV